MSFAGTLGISKREFYLKIGVSRGTLESKTGITEDVLTKFIATFPDISLDWLIMGVGDMLRPKDCSSRNEQPHSPQSTNIQPSNNDVTLAILGEMAKKDAIITEQAEEIGRLREKVYQLEKEKQVTGSSATNANDTSIANVG